MEFAPALPAANAPAPTQGYGSAEPGQSWKHGRFSGRDFVRQPNGTLRCPAGQTLAPTEQRREADGSLRVLYEARICDCRPWHLRELCQWHGSGTTKPRRVSVHLSSAGYRLCCLASSATGADEHSAEPAGS